jgi:copper chaperone
MISFQVNDMTCAHCVGAITRALKAADATAKLRFDLAAQRVDIEAGQANAAELGQAIRQSGYAPVQITRAIGADDPRSAAVHRGCCCSARTFAARAP